MLERIPSEATIPEVVIKLFLQQKSIYVYDHSA